jgi:ketosteroid isomerase-like protein
MKIRTSLGSLAMLAIGCLATAESVAATVPAAARADAGPGDAALAAQVQQVDDQLSAAFNAHDLTALMALFAEDVEFFQDHDGLQHFAEVKADFGRLFAQNSGIRRELVAGSFGAYPVPGYGAIEVGAHRFCHREHGREDCGTFEFVHVWRHESAGWKLARVVSYGH